MILIVGAVYVIMIYVTAFLYGRVDPDPVKSGETPTADLIALFWPVGLVVVAYYAGIKTNKQKG